MKYLFAIPLGTAALFTLVACGNPEASDRLDEPTANTETENSVRENQLESDERAQQQREEMLDNQAEGGADPASDRELATQIQENLDSQLPDNQLSVEAEDGIVTVVGDVASEAELQQVESLVAATAGVQSVDMQVNVVAPAS